MLLLLLDLNSAAIALIPEYLQLKFCFSVFFLQLPFFQHSQNLIFTAINRIKKINTIVKRCSPANHVNSSLTAKSGKIRSSSFSPRFFRLNNLILLEFSWAAIHGCILKEAPSFLLQYLIKVLVFRHF